MVSNSSRFSETLVLPDTSVMESTLSCIDFVLLFRVCLISDGNFILKLFVLEVLKEIGDVSL